MSREIYIGSHSRTWVGLCAWMLSVVFAMAEAPKRVLILNPFGRDTEPYSAAVSSFRSTLAREYGEAIDIHEIPLDLARFSGQEGEEPLVTFLEERIKKHPVDLVVPIGGSAVKFAGRHRERLFPETPIVITSAEPRMIPAGFLERNATLVTQKADLGAMVEDILQMQPDTKRIAMVFGSSPLEKFWSEQCRAAFQRFENRVEFVWLDDLSMDEMLGRCSTLSPRSFIFHCFFLVDAEGISCEKNEALHRLHELANAPVFSVFSSELGQGSVGGRLYQNSELGVRGARVALRVLRGEKAHDIPPVVLEDVRPVYDWRELQRWKIKESRLPAGSLIKFRQPGLWERYHWQVIGVILFGTLQAGLIFGLLVNRKRRLQSETEAALVADISSKFVNLPADQVDHEIFDAQRRICELMDIDLAALWQQWPDRNPGTFTATHVYSLQHGPQPSSEMTDDDYPWVRAEILAGRLAAHRSLSDMPTAAAKDRESARQVGIKSHLTLPLSLGGDAPIGILGFNTTRKERDWPTPLIERLQLVAEIVANALSRKMADQDLRESEMLNRKSMEQAMELRDTLAHSDRVTLLGQLASALAHELSQPLGAILRNAEAAEIMLKETSPDIEELQAITDDILRDDQRAAKVIDKLRSLLKKGRLALEPLDLPEVITEVMALVQADASARHMTLSFSGAPVLPVVLGDRIHLQQVLLNLIVNAMDSMSDSNCDLCAVQVHAHLTDTHAVEVRVCDDGPGIADEHLESLFLPFFTTKAQGMGMGLPVSKTIIEAHKGTLRAENRTDGGACFCFTLPAVPNP